MNRRDLEVARDEWPALRWRIVSDEEGPGLWGAGGGVRVWLFRSRACVGGPVHPDPLWRGAAFGVTLRDALRDARRIAGGAP